MIEATSDGKNFEPIPAGTYAARCYQMVHIGTVVENYMGTDKEMNKARIYWELPTETKAFKEGEEAKPYSVSKEFTLSMHEKSNLRKFLEGWRGKGFSEEEAKKFDITKLLGVSCLLSIVHKTSKDGKVYANISSVSTLPKGMVCPPLVSEVFEFTYTPFSQEKFDKLPDWLKDKIKLSKEYRELEEPNHQETKSDTSTDDNEDLPF
jgi:hypothetical protein